MESKHLHKLQRAKKYFYSMEFNEAYAILRRYFDRIPFEFEAEHAEYIGIYTRILAETGKTSELSFYIAKLEEIYQKSKDPNVGYSLAAIYRTQSMNHFPRIKELLSSIIKESNPVDIQNKAKMLLAFCYDLFESNTNAAASLIESIVDPSQKELRNLWLIWKAKIAKDRGNYSRAHGMLDELFAQTTIESDWYAFFSAKLVEAGLLLKEERQQEAMVVLEVVRSLIGDRPLKSLRAKVGRLERDIQAAFGEGKLEVHGSELEQQLLYQGKRMTVKAQSPVGRLISKFMQQPLIDKAEVVRTIYDREYEGPNDDRLVYYHIHALRKRLKSLGVPGEVVEREECGYRLMPEVSQLNEVQI